MHESALSFTKNNKPMDNVHFIYPSYICMFYLRVYHVICIFSQLEHLQGTRKLEERKVHEGKNFFESESSHELNLNIHTYTHRLNIHT